MGGERIGRAAARLHRAPTSCPVCSHELITLRVGCPDCGTELSGHFASCRFCGLDPADAALLDVFLRSRGNIRDAQAHLGVSYPTARQRVGELLGRLGYAEVAEPPDVRVAGRGSKDVPLPDDAVSAVDRSISAGILADLAAGRISVEEAAELLRPGR